MIIDFHWHFTHHKLSEADALRRSQNHIAIHYRAAGIPVEQSLDELARARIDFSDDPNGSKLLRRMDDAGIDVTVMFSNDRVWERLDDATILEEQRRCSDLAKLHPDRLIPFASIIPTRSAAPQLFRHCVEDLGARGLKWEPFYGFDPTTDEAFEVLRVADELGVPLLMHTGMMYDYGDIKYAHPLLLDPIAAEFPGLTVVAAHSAHLMWRDWASVAFFRRNVFGDLALWQFLALGNYEWFCRSLREMIDLVGIDRILWSSDGPWTECVVSNARWVQIMKDLPTNAPDGVRFTDGEVTAMLGGNAARLLRMPEVEPSPPIDPETARLAPG